MEHIKDTGSNNGDWYISDPFGTKSTIIYALMKQFNVCQSSLVMVDTLRLVGDNVVAFRARIFGMPGAIIGKGEIYATSIVSEPFNDIIVSRYMKLFCAMG